MVGTGELAGRDSNDEAGSRRGRRTCALLVAGLVLLLSCRNWDNPLDPTGNHRPITPANPQPADAGIAVSVGLALRWHSVDQDEGDTAYFDIFLGTDTQPGLVRAALTDTIFQPANVACSTRYYWRVIAYDNHHDSAFGPLWHFTTAALFSVTAPDTGERLMMYSQDTITWSGGPAVLRPASVRGIRSTGVAGVRCSRPVPVGADSTVVYHSVNDGASWVRLGQVTAPGSYVWQVSGPATESARVKVIAYAASDTMSGTSGRFVIQDTVPPSAITVTSPDSTSVWNIGSAHDVTWTGGDGADSSAIYCSTDNGASWARQGWTATRGVFAWIVSGPATAQAMVEVRAYDLAGMTTGRSGAFGVTEPRPSTGRAIPRRLLR